MTKLKETEKALREYASQHGWPPCSEWDKYANQRRKEKEMILPPEAVFSFPHRVGRGAS